MKIPLVIFGSGEIAQLAHYYFTNDSNYEVAAFTVDPEYKKTESFCDLPLVSFEEVEKLFSPTTHRFFVALSYAKLNLVRKEKFLSAKARGYTLASYISSYATVLNQGQIGENCFIFEDNTIQPFVSIGSNVTLWSGNHIGHHSVIHDHVFITSHVVISGGVTVGEQSFLGVNATIRNGIFIAPRTVVGAGSLIMKDTAEKDVYIPRRTELFPKKSDEITL